MTPERHSWVWRETIRLQREAARASRAARELRWPHFAVLEQYKAERLYLSARRGVWELMGWEWDE